MFDSCLYPPKHSGFKYCAYIDALKVRTFSNLYLDEIHVQNEDALIERRFQHFGQVSNGSWYFSRYSPIINNHLYTYVGDYTHALTLPDYLLFGLRVWMD